MDRRSLTRERLPAGRRHRGFALVAALSFLFAACSGINEVGATSSPPSSVAPVSSPEVGSFDICGLVILFERAAGQLKQAVALYDSGDESGANALALAAYTDVFARLHVAPTRSSDQRVNHAGLFWLSVGADELVLAASINPSIHLTGITPATRPIADAAEALDQALNLARGLYEQARLAGAAIPTTCPGS
jgi:hypothetical protein